MKFSIRDLLLVTVIVAILVAWWVDRRQQATIRQKLQREALCLFSVAGHGYKLGSYGPGLYQNSGLIRWSRTLSGLKNVSVSVLLIHL